MIELWYAIAALMFAIYVVLDGFDLGAGIVAPLVARTDSERRRVLAAIGPYWDGNEVWLLAAGGALFVAFPAVLAAGLSGFYFAIFLVIWCLIGRGVSIEFRSHVPDALWPRVSGPMFSLTSFLLAFLFGIALGNVIRGVPLDEAGWFSLALFTDFSAHPPVGILDGYTIAVGAFAVVVLNAHGAAFVAMRSDGMLRERCLMALRRSLVITVIAWPLVTWATARVRPGFFAAFHARPGAWAPIALAAI